MKKQIIFMFFSVLMLSGIITSCTTQNEVSGVTISSSSDTLTLGQTDTLTATPNYTGNIVPSVQWSTSNDSIVTVSGGIIEAISKGTATITASAGGKSVTCDVTVNDQITPETTQGLMVYQGDYYSTGSTSNFLLLLIGPNVSITDGTGEGDFLYLEVNTSDSLTDSIPDGIYTISSTDAAGTSVQAWASSTSAGGTWFVSKDYVYHPIYSGKAVITYENGEYNIDYEFLDFYGNTISGNHKSTLIYYDNSSSAISSSSIKANKIKANNSFMLWQRAPELDFLKKIK